MDIFLKLSVVKETARRFKDNSEICYATAADREFSASKPYVTLVADTATWHNKWNAAGKNYLGHDSL
jgi:preprotein translocase subunit SecA